MLRARKTGWGAFVLLGSLAASLLGCPGKPPPEAPPPPPAPEPELDVPDGPPEPEAIETGKDCASAEAVCDVGVCTAKVKNSCEQPVTCALEAMAMCQGTEGAGEARGKDRGTVAAGDEGELRAVADCQDQAVASTIVENLNCE